MKYRLKVYSIWEFGQRKDAQGNPHQEDSIFPAYGEQQDADRLFILCDGMGGHDAGEVASATVCEAMSRSILSHADADTAFSDAMLQEAIGAAFDALDSKDTGAAKKMGTTLALLKLHSGGATIAHMGDSRVYHIRPGRDKLSTTILSVTQDHSLVNYLVRSGEMTAEEAKRSPQKNVITRAMQPHMEKRPKADIFHTSDIKAGDYFYLCSDGMLEEMDDDNLRFFFSGEKVVRTDEQKVEKLRQATADNRDNHSAIIVHILAVDGGAEEPATADADGGAEEPASAGADTAVPAQEPPATRGGGKRRWAILAVVIAALLAVAALAYWHFGLSDSKTSHRQTIENPMTNSDGGTV